MPSARWLARTTMAAAFQRMKARMRRSMSSSPGNTAHPRPRSSSHTASTPWRGTRPRRRARSSSFMRERRPGLALGAQHRLEALDPLGRRLGHVGQLVGKAVEDHCPSRYRPVAPSSMGQSGHSMLFRARSAAPAADPRQDGERSTVAATLPSRAARPRTLDRLRRDPSAVRRTQVDGRGAIVGLEPEEGSRLGGQVLGDEATRAVHVASGRSAKPGPRSRSMRASTAHGRAATAARVSRCSGRCWWTPWPPRRGR